MNINLIITLLRNPSKGWELIQSENLSIKQCYARYVIPLALIAPVSAYIGTSHVGWRVGAGDPVRLTAASAFKLSSLSFLSMLVVVFVLAKTMHWMATTYESSKPLSACVSLSTFTAVPLFLVGITLLAPVPWFIYLVGLPTLGYSVVLLYTGVPIMMEIDKERGFLFSSSVLALGLISLVGLLVVTVSLWGFGIGPSFKT